MTRRLAIVSMLKNKEYKVYKSDKKRFIAVCVDPFCRWRFRATRKMNGSVWFVTKYHNIHSCSKEFITHEHCQAKSKVLGDMIRYRYTNPTHAYPPYAVMAEVKERLKVDISYEKAWRAKEHALKLIRGTPEESFQKLPAYLHRVEKVNPGTVTRIQTDQHNHFLYCFMALGVCIRGFKSCIRPVVAVDATHLKGQYHGVLLLATGMDGNNQIYPLAFCIADSENDASWNWFMMRLYDILGEIEGLVIISDIHKSIEKGIKDVFPNAHHGICMYHLRQNLVAKFKGVDVSSIFYCAAKTYDEAEFVSIMNVIRATSLEVYNYLIEADVEKWARVYFTGRRYSIMTTNIAESMNSVYRDVREFPPVSLLDAVINKLSSWFVERRQTALKMKTLTAWADKKFDLSDELSRTMEVRRIHHYSYQVMDGDKNAEVDLNEKICSCNKFQLDQFPCSHALAAASKSNISRYALASKYYTSDALLAAYAEPIFPVGHEDYWETPDEVSNMVILPPLMRRPSGRPRKNRILSQGEEVVRKKCKRCNRIGHNRRTCKYPIAVGT